MSKTRLVDLGIVTSFILYSVSAILKFVFALISGSSALYADALNSITDVIATVIMFVGVQFSRKPTDDNHHYGHQRYEQISAMIAVMIMAIAGFEAFRQGVMKIINPETTPPNFIAVVAAIIAAILIGTSAIVNNYIYQKTKAMAANVIAKDNLSDALVSVGVAIAVIAARFGFPIIDPIASIVVAFIILKTSYELMMEAIHQLTDGFDAQKADDYEREALSVTGVKRIKSIRGRFHGTDEYIEITVLLDKDLSLITAHDIAENIEQHLNKIGNICETIVHFEPDME